MLNHDRDCVVTKTIHDKFRLWLYNDEKTIVLETWIDGDMIQVTFAPEHPSYTKFWIKLFN